MDNIYVIYLVWIAAAGCFCSGSFLAVKGIEGWGWAWLFALFCGLYASSIPLT